MPNHVHLIVVPQTADGLCRAVGEAHRRYTRALRLRTDDELAALHRCLSRGRPFGSDVWVRRIAKKVGLESTLRPRIGAAR